MASSKNVVEETKVVQPEKKTEKKAIFSLGSIDHLWLSLFGLCLPIFGIIWALVWKKSKPSESKSLMTASLICLLGSLVLALVLYIVLVDFGWAFGLDPFIRERMSEIFLKLK